MDSEYDYLIENIKEINYDVQEYKSKYRSSDDIIRVMAVTKTVPADVVNIVIDNGLHLIGENRVQEYLSKRDEYQKPCEIHFIGHLQKNKVKFIDKDISMIQSVDSVDLAREIDRYCNKNNRVMDILLEVNIGEEENKTGFSQQSLIDGLYTISEMKNISIKGLMCIPPKLDTEKFFSKMREVFIDIKDKNIDNVNMSILSMGMSSDYKMAIKYGANIIRIGTKLFGTRK